MNEGPLNPLFSFNLLNPLPRLLFLPRTTVLFIHRSPRNALCLLGRGTALFVSFFNVFRLALLLCGIGCFGTSSGRLAFGGWHRRKGEKIKMLECDDGMGLIFRQKK